MVQGVAWGLLISLPVLGLLVYLATAFPLRGLAEQRAGEQGAQRAALVALCDLPAGGELDGRRVAHHTGTVGDRPTAAGYWGDNDGPHRLLGEIVFVQVDGRDQPIGVRGLPGELPAGTPLRFCAAADGTRLWWPLVGYEAGRNGGRLYGEPSGPFDAVMWLRDTEG